MSKFILRTRLNRVHHECFVGAVNQTHTGDAESRRGPSTFLRVTVYQQKRDTHTSSGIGGTPVGPILKGPYNGWLKHRHAAWIK